MTEEKSENLSKVKNPNWGGVRPGQGRPRKALKNVNRQISLPPELDARLKALSEREGRSFSSLLVSLILKGLDG